MSQKFTVLFDLDGTLIDTAPDLMLAHNHVMKKFGYEERELSDIKKLAGGGSRVMLRKSCLLYTSPSPRDMRRSRMPSSA